MKLRIKGNSLRMRLSRSEVDAFVENGVYVQSMTWGLNSELTYGLEVGDGDALDLQHANDRLIVGIPRAQAQRWASTDEVGMRGQHVFGDVTTRILIEKDWNCLAPRPDEDESDAFKHPKESIDSC